MNKIKIINNGPSTYIYINGVEIKGITKYSITHGAGKPPVFEYEATKVNFELEIETNEIYVDTEKIKRTQEFKKIFKQEKGEK